MGFRKLFNALKGQRRTPVRQPLRRRPTRLAVETLEDRAVPASFSISDISILEGDSGTRNAAVTVSLTGAGNTGGLSVGYVTANDTARAGSDYQGVSGTLTFGKGVTSKTILIPIYGDTNFESDESFYVNLRNPKKATIADGQGVVTILNDDTRIYIGDVSLSEGNSGTTSFNFSVTLSNASNVPVTVSYVTANGSAVAGSDFEAASGTLMIPAGQTSGTITVLVNGDGLVEPDEEFFVNLSNPVNAQLGNSQGWGSIQSDDNAVLHIDSWEDWEPDPNNGGGWTTFYFTVWLSAPVSETVTVNFETLDDTAFAGSDYQHTSGTLTFDPGVTSKTIEVKVYSDFENEWEEWFYVMLSNTSSNALIQPGWEYGYGIIYNTPGG